jgi:hypothetical protein
MKKLRRPWTEKDESDLLKWDAEGVSVMLIAARLKRTMMAVHGRLTILRQRLRSKPHDQIAIPDNPSEVDVKTSP